MTKQKFVGEYQINASRKMLFPYLSTATGLCQWFADDVNINNIDKTLIFILDGEERIAVIDSIKNNRLNRCNGELSLHVLDILDTIIKSAKEDKKLELRSSVSTIEYFSEEENFKLLK